MQLDLKWNYFHCFSRPFAQLRREHHLLASFGYHDPSMGFRCLFITFVSNTGFCLLGHVAVHCVKRLHSVLCSATCILIIALQCFTDSECCFLHISCFLCASLCPFVPLQPFHGVIAWHSQRKICLKTHVTVHLRFPATFSSPRVCWLYVSFFILCS